MRVVYQGGRAASGSRTANRRPSRRIALREEHSLAEPFQDRSGSRLRLLEIAASWTWSRTSTGTSQRTCGAARTARSAV